MKRLEVARLGMGSQLQEGAWALAGCPQVPFLPRYQWVLLLRCLRLPHGLVALDEVPSVELVLLDSTCRGRQVMWSGV